MKHPKIHAPSVFGLFACLLALLAFGTSTRADLVDLNNITDSQKALLAEHVFGGLPSQDNIYIRQGYILSYNPQTKTPKWVAYHIKPEYGDTPARKGKFKTFRNDPDMEEEARDADYNGLFTSRGYAGGHLAPYGVMGGDRDGDGQLAKDGDADDEITVFQSNYMGNIAPQHHYGFNGSPGLWYKLERWVQYALVKKQGKEVWVFAGSIFGPGEHEKVGQGKASGSCPCFTRLW